MIFKSQTAEFLVFTRNSDDFIRQKVINIKFYIFNHQKFIYSAELPPMTQFNPFFDITNVV